MYDDSSDEDLSTSSKKKSQLHSLFNERDSSKGDFSHKRPKQPGHQNRTSKETSSSSRSISGPEPFYAVPSPGVTIYKFDNQTKQFPSLGTVGAAVLYDRSTSKFTLYFYYTKDKKLFDLQLTSRFQYTVQETDGGAFGSFLDNQKQRWSIRFETKEISEAFAMHIAFAVYASGSRDDIFILELDASKGEEVKEGDTVGTVWTGYSINFKSSPLKLEHFHSNDKKKPQRYTLGTNTVIEAWDIGTMGMKVKGRRIVVAPPRLAEGQERGLEPPVPKDCHVLFVIELDKTKRNQNPSKSHPTKHQPQLPDLDDEDSDTGSIALQKAHRLAAKQSKSRLPEGVYIEDDMDHIQPQRHSNQYSGVMQQQQHQQHQQQQQQQQQLGWAQPQVSATMPPQPTLQQALVPLSQSLPYGQFPNSPYQPTPSYYAPPPAPAPVPVAAPTVPSHIISPSSEAIMVDERNYKAQINTKLDGVLSKVDQLAHTIALTRDSDVHTSSGISSKALLSTIQRIVTDNDRMLKDVEEKTHLVDKLRVQVIELQESKQKIVEENNRYIEERNRNYNENTNIHKKKMDDLIDQKEALQIEISDAAAGLANANRRFENLKKKFLNQSEELKNTQEELSREKVLRDKEKTETESAVIELNNFKQKYKEENRKMKESNQERDDALSQLSAAKEQIERLNKNIEERTQQYAKEKATLELDHLQERNNLHDQVENLKLELRTERLSVAKKIQESEESFAAQAKQQQDELKSYVQRELERRVAAAVESALAEAAIKSEEVKQQALIEARRGFIQEKERASKLLQDDFNARLQQEIKVAFEKGKQSGFKEGTSASEKQAQVLAQTQAQLREVDAKSRSLALQQIQELERDFEAQKNEYERKIASQQKLITNLKHQAAAGGVKGGGYSRDELESIVKKIINESFRAFREAFNADTEYSGETVIESVKTILVSKTLSALPKEEPEEEPEPEPIPVPQVQQYMEPNIVQEPDAGQEQDAGQELPEQGIPEPDPEQEPVSVLEQPEPKLDIVSEPDIKQEPDAVEESFLFMSDNESFNDQQNKEPEIDSFSELFPTNDETENEPVMEPTSIPPTEPESVLFQIESYPNLGSIAPEQSTSETIPEDSPSSEILFDTDNIHIDEIKDTELESTPPNQDTLEEVIDSTLPEHHEEVEEKISEKEEIIDASTVTDEPTNNNEKVPNEPVVSEKTPDEPAVSEKTPDEPVVSEKTPDEPAVSEKTPDELVVSEKTPDEPVVSEKTPDTTTVTDVDDWDEDTDEPDSQQVKDTTDEIPVPIVTEPPTTESTEGETNDIFDSLRTDDIQENQPDITSVSEPQISPPKNVFDEFDNDGDAEDPLTSSLKKDDNFSGNGSKTDNDTFSTVFGEKKSPIDEVFGSVEKPKKKKDAFETFDNEEDDFLGMKSDPLINPNPKSVPNSKVDFNSSSTASLFDDDDSDLF